MVKSFAINIEESKISEYFHADIVDALQAMEVDAQVELTDGTIIARCE